MKKLMKSMLVLVLICGIMSSLSLAASAESVASVNEERNYEFTFPDYYVGSMRSTGLYEKKNTSAPFVYPQYSEHTTWYFLAPKILDSSGATSPVIARAGEKVYFTWYDGYGGIGQNYCLSGYPDANGHNKSYLAYGTWSE